MLSSRDRTIAKQFSDAIRQQFPDAQIWAFGSRARGDAHEYSDLDICIVLDKLNRTIKKAISDTAWEIGFENEILIMTIQFSRDQFLHGPCAISPLVLAIQREGIAL